MIRDRWMVAATIGLLAGGLFFYKKVQEVPVYASTTTMLIDYKEDQVVDIERVVDTTLNSEVELNNHRALLESRTFLQRVADTFPEEKADEFIEAYREEDMPEPSVIGILAGGLSIGRVGSTFIFTITFEHRDPRMAAFASRLYAEEYIEFILDRAETGNVSAIKFLTAQAEELKRKVEEGERAVQEYRARNNMVSLEDNQNVVISRMRTLDNALTQVNIERLAQEARLRSIRDTIDSEEDLLNNMAVAGFGNIQGLENQRQQLEAERELLSQRYLERHPRMVELEQQIVNVEHQLKSNLAQAVTREENTLKLILKRQENLQEEYEKAEAEALLLDRLAIQFDVMRREQQANTNLFNSVNTRLNEARISSELETTSIRIIDPAIPSSKPVRPDEKKIMTFAIGIFLAVFAAVPIGLEFLNSKLHSHWDVQVFLGRELLGDISLNRRLSRSELAKTVSDEHDTTLTENFRAIYGHMNLHSEVDPPKCILVSSTIPGEGKTFFSGNLASVFAKHGVKTLLLDADLRRPSVAQNFDLESENGLVTWWDSGRPGLEDMSVPLSSCKSLGICNVSPNFNVLPAARKTSSTTEIFTDPAFATLVRRLKDEFQVVIFDTPPAGIFPDSVFLADYAEETVFVVKYNSVSRSRVKQVLAHLERSKTSILGIVLNAVSNKARKRYGYSSYYDYNYYGRYYDRDDTRESKKAGTQAKPVTATPEKSESVS